jgi:thiamine biosynthesis lipoprotein
MAAEAVFRAMGSDAHLVVVGGRPGAVVRARARIIQLEQRWSRFVPSSEVSQLNDRAGEPLAVSADTVLLVQRATEAWRFSGGAFDPTVLGPLVRAGYDRSFEQLAGPGAETHGEVDRRALLGLGAADIEIDGARVRLPAGTGFDPGGIGKGLAADLVVAELLAEGAEGACVNLGGDVRVAGDPPDGDAWTVSVDHPRRDRPLAHLGLRDGAVATSTTLRRRWTVDGADRHHLIDPRSGLPSDTDVELATVVAAEAWIAEALTKAVLLRRSEVAFDVIDGTAAEALAVDGQGRMRSTPGLAAYLGVAAAEPVRGATSAESVA